MDFFRAGTTSDIMGNASGTAISATGMYIESLIMRSFRTFSSLLGLHEEMASLFGVVGRVTDLMLVLDEVRPRAGSAAEKQTAAAAVLASNVGGAFSPRGARESPSFSGGIRMAGCDLVTPSGRCLAKQLSFSLSPARHAGAHLAVVGPSGSGKSSLFKTLGGLWPLPAGSVALPQRLTVGGLALISQRPLVTAAPVSLADYLTYPLSHWSDQIETQIRSDLQVCKVEGLADREGWETPKAWHEVLSLGEQQALAIVRLLHHQPSFAVLDEAMSGLAADVISAVYDAFQERGIQVVAISQALVEPALRYHTRALRLGECCASGWQEEALGVLAHPSLQGLRSSPVAAARASSHGDVVLVEHGDDDGWESGSEPDDGSPVVAG